MDYLGWNNCLAAHFFNEQMDGREVILNVDEKVLEQVSQHGLNSFVSSTKQGPPWATREGLCMKAYQAFADWRDRQLQFPPYISYLCLFVLAHGVEGNFNPNAYYPKLHKILGEDRGLGTPPSFDKMIDLWDDLERWSKEDESEELGSFTARIRGKHIHIGLPLSQTILTNEERNRLPRFFDKADLEPGQHVSSEILLDCLGKFGRDCLSVRTKKLISTTQTEFKELKQVLVQFLQDEVLFWDGTFPKNDGDSKKLNRTRLGVRLCLDIEPLSSTVKSCLRLKFNKSVPHTEFDFYMPDEPDTRFSCRESQLEWSSPIVFKGSNERFDAFSLAWCTDNNFIDDEETWKARLVGKQIRLFKKGHTAGLPNNWVETRQNLQRNVEFLVVCASEFEAGVAKWIQSDCEDLLHSQRLTNGWSLFRAKNAQKSFGGSNILTFAPDLNLRFVGGFKFGRGNKFFDFGLPKIELENAADEKIRLLGDVFEAELVKQSDGHNVWWLPENVPIGETFRFEVLRGTEKAALRRNYILKTVSESILPIGEIHPPLRLPNGALDRSRSAATEFVVGADTFPRNLRSEIALTTLPLHMGTKTVLIGQNVGEITEFPNEPVSNIWRPVWALAKQGRKNWAVIFCGDSLDAEPKVNRSASVNLQKKWKKFLWINRKRHDTEALRLKPVRDLWEVYKRAAENF